MATRVMIRQHCSNQQVLKEDVDLRYPFISDELEFIASKDEDRYPPEVHPKTFPYDKAFVSSESSTQPTQKVPPG